MPKKKTEFIVQVFVASPGDVEGERTVLEDVIRYLNKTWRETYNIRLELIMWETHSAPGVSDEVQDKLNEQIRKSCDVFIGIFWTHLGTSTNRGESRTVEEFNVAYEKHRDDPNSIEIMMYFKEALLKPSQIDLEKLKEVKEFRASLNDQFFLGEFESTESFKELVTKHLNQKVKEWDKRYNNKSTSVGSIEPEPPVKSKKPEKDEVVEEDDLIREIERGTGWVERATHTLEHIDKPFEDLYGKLNKRGPKGKKQKKTSTMTMSRKDIPRTMAGGDHVLKDLTEWMSFEIPYFEKLLSNAMVFYNSTLGKRVEFFNGHFNTIQHALATIGSFRAEAVNANFAVKYYRTMISGLLRSEPEFERAWYRTSESIDTLLQHIENGKQQATKVETYLSELI